MRHLEDLRVAAERWVCHGGDVELEALATGVLDVGPRWARPVVDEALWGVWHRAGVAVRDWSLRQGMRRLLLAHWQCDWHVSADGLVDVDEGRALHVAVWRCAAEGALVPVHVVLKLLQCCLLAWVGGLWSRGG